MAEIFLTDLQLAARYGVHRSTLWRWTKKNPAFPRPFTLSPGCSRWKFSAVENWEAMRSK